MIQREIVHLDADAFFASVEQAANPRLRGKAIAVGGEKRGIIASASYEARKMGVYTPMPSSRARKLCPKLIILPGDFEKYERFSRWMFSYAYDFTPDVEISSIDEGYFDLTGTRKNAVEIAGRIRQAIQGALKISVSKGIARNKLVSQIAAKLNKPAAFVWVPPGTEASYLQPLPNKWLPGIGPKTSDRLAVAGLAQIGQIAVTPIEYLSLVLGRTAPQVREFANGIDERPVVPAEAPAKSYSHQETFGEDVTNEEKVDATLRHMADRLMAAVRDESKSIRTLTVKVRYNDMAEEQRSESLIEPTDLETDVYGKISQLLKAAWSRRVSLRMVSLKFSNVYDAFPGSELELNSRWSQRDQRHRLAEAMDELRRAHGAGILLRGHDFALREQSQETLSLRQPIRVQVRPPLLLGRRGGPSSSTVTIPLQARSYYSFLNSILSPEGLVKIARAAGLAAITLTDESNLHGAVEFTQAAQAAGIKPVLGASVTVDGKSLRLYARNSAGYRNLCALLNLPAIVPANLAEHAEGLLAASSSADFASLFPGHFYLEASLANARQLGRCQTNLPIVWSEPLRYPRPEDRLKFDIAQSIRTRTLLRQPHPAKELGGEFHFRLPEELGEIRREHPDWFERTHEIAERCSFEFPFGKPQFPAFQPPDASTPAEFLASLVWEGLRKRYGNRSETYRAQVREELGIIHEVGYEEYFLVVWSLLQECQKRGIHWITRGSAADSLVCYCLGISNVCPIRFDLYFRRFLNKERMLMDKLPDIDIDFAHDRKDDVINLIFEKYGREHVAVVGGFSTFQARSAMAEVAKVLGVSEYEIRHFTERLPYGRARDLQGMVADSIECRDLPADEEPYATALKMAVFLDGFPRYAKMHPCGVVISRDAMSHLTPSFISQKGYPTAHLDMHAVEAVGLIKMDILAQGGLAVMRDVENDLKARGIGIDLEGLEPWENPEVWEMIANGGARAVHHIESPAMIGLCRMCNVRDIDGLVAIVSVIRPGAANENKKVSFTRRYQELEPVVYPHPSLEPCLRSTFGMVVYEEHILQICEAFAGLPGGRADVLRRALGKEKTETIEQLRLEFIECARQRGRTEAEITEVWDLVSSFRGYAFCKAHSTAYGVEAYQSAWLKRYYPTEFMAAVLSNGKGFYAPLVYVLESLRLGIRFLPPSINDPGPLFRPDAETIRVPATWIKGLTERTKNEMVARRKERPFRSLRDFHERVLPAPEEMEALLKVGALDEFGFKRSALFWEVQALARFRGGPGDSRQGWLLPSDIMKPLPEAALQEPSRMQRLEWETELLGFPVSGHPLDLYPKIAWETYCPIKNLAQYCGQEVIVCGLIVEGRVHHQVTGEPMKFLTITDYTGMIETELFAKTYKSYGLATVRYPVLEVTATVEPYENGRGYSLRVHRAGRPREKK